MPARIAMATAFLAVSAVGLGACGEADAPEKRLRVVLITLDTLRYDAFMGVGGNPSWMPLVRARAERGARFTRFYASSSTTQPSHASMFTGQHPWEHGVTRNGQVLGDGVVTVAERLQQAGFETRAVVASFPVSSRFGYGQGFDGFVEEFGASFFERDTWEKEWEIPGGEFFAMAEAVTANAMAALDASQAPRQFFWFHFFDPHSPYGGSKGGDLNRRVILRRVREGESAAAEILREARDLYAADLEYLDGFLDRLLARLERDTDIETHVFVVADHGESFGEAGALGHGWRLSDEQIRVPAFILSPRVRAGARHDVAGSVDVAPTLLSLAGLPAEAEAVGGRDLSAATRDGSGAYGMRRTFVQDPPVEIRLDGSRHEVERLLFYAVDADGRMQTGNSTSADGSPLGSLFRSFETRLGEARPDQEVDPTVREALEALGYVE